MTSRNKELILESLISMIQVGDTIYESIIIGWGDIDFTPKKVKRVNENTLDVNSNNAFTADGKPINRIIHKSELMLHYEGFLYYE